MVPLRTKCSSALLAAVLIFASGCHKQSTELSPEQSETKEAFEIAQAMKMFYGYLRREKANVGRVASEREK